jgi:hypothetical protein
MPLVRLDDRYSWEDRAELYRALGEYCFEPLTRWGYLEMSKYCQRRSIERQFAVARDVKYALIKTKLAVLGAEK